MGILYALVSVRMLKESSLTGEAIGAPLSFQSGINSSSPRDSNTLPVVRYTHVARHIYDVMGMIPYPSGNSGVSFLGASTGEDC